MNETKADPPAPPKADPGSLALRAAPRPAVRFRRGLIIGIAGLGSAAIVAVTWLALQPAGLRLVGEPRQLYGGERKAPPEAVAKLPRSYGELRDGVPKLGPALPGDLGRPILEAQRETGDSAVERGGLSDPAAQMREAEVQRLQAERQRRDAERRAGREAPVLAQLSGSPTPAAVIASHAGGAAAAELASPAGAERRPAVRASEGDAASALRHRLQLPQSPWQLSAGTIIPASLVTGINSGLPGLVVAQVTQNVADSATGRTVLIPQGSRLIGSYDHVVGFGQRRVLLVWQRLVLPDGASLQLDNLPASDAAGYAGLEDEVDSHSWQLLKGVALSALLGVGTELTLGSTESDLVRALRESAQRSGAEAGQQLVSKNLGVQPTITVRPGWPLRVVVHKDLVLQPWRQ